MRGDKLKALRRRRSLTQRALGEAMGVSHSAISDWERSGCASPESVAKIAAFFNVTVAELEEAPNTAEAKPATEVVVSGFNPAYMFNAWENLRFNARQMSDFDLEQASSLAEWLSRIVEEEKQRRGKESN